MPASRNLAAFDVVNGKMVPIQIDGREMKE